MVAGQTPKWSGDGGRVMLWLPALVAGRPSGHRAGLCEQPVISRQMARLSMPQNFGLGLAAVGLAVHVGDGRLVVGHPVQRDAVQGVVGLPVTAAGEPVAAGLAG